MRKHLVTFDDTTLFVTCAYNYHHNLEKVSLSRIVLLTCADLQHYHKYHFNQDVSVIGAYVT